MPDLSLFWPIRKLEPNCSVLMMQFDWLIALGLVKCERLMEQFDWVIALGLVSCELLMQQFDWLIALAASSSFSSLSLYSRFRSISQ